jgi:outer membrane protein, multidrug efflux system
MAWLDHKEIPVAIAMNANRLGHYSLKNGRKFGIIASLAIALSGCAAMPTPLTDGERELRVQADLGSMFKDQEPIQGAIDLDEAVARGLKYNLDKRLKQMERALVEAGNAHVAAGMLPRLASSAGYRARDTFRGSSSRSLITGAQSLEVSTSEDKEVSTLDLAVVWNVLDFGLTYLKSKQQADQTLIAEERRLKVAQNVVLDIRDAYWRSVAAETMLPRVGRLIDRIEGALVRSRGVVKSGSGEPNDELRQQRELLSNLRDLAEIRRKLSLAKSELAALMNVPRGAQFKIVIPGAGLTTPRLKADVTALEDTALLNRPELREEDYKKRISRTELDAAWVRLLPGFELRAGTNFDSNSFLADSNWNDAAAVITKNLMELIAAPRAIAFAEREVDVADSRRLALSMAVIAQLHIALQRYAMAQDVFTVNKRLLDVDRQLSVIADNSTEASATAEVEALSALARKTVSELQYYTAYADVQNAHARILNSLGLPRPPEGIEAAPIADLKLSVHAMLNDWQGSVASLTVASQ